ncbi:LuxR C-terminal-related transcriptional regulator [Amycolatopsis sp. NPDC059021]|uniref:LuxR C-terminal-related transcriptional regulator n=1 Tax=Amycolatopsis sp. NPDC059021 TaxID=3346704 RepID=UPI00366F1F73
MSTRVFLLDDDPVFRAGLRVTIGEAEDVVVVGEAAGWQDAVRQLHVLKPPADVVLLSSRKTGYGDTEALRGLSANGFEWPVPRILVFSQVDDDDAVVAALRAGARGYLVQGVSAAELVRSIHFVADGGAVFAPVIASRLGNYFSAVHEIASRVAFPELTDRERQVLDLVARGYENRRIARELVLSEKTVRNHVSRLFAKLQVVDRAAAALRARDAGLGV